jgi:hypothetical protein
VNTNDGSAATKPFLERLIVQHGGKKVQNLMRTTTHIIAERDDFKVRSLIQKYNMNIVKNKWVLACSDRGFLLELEPNYMIYSNQELCDYFKDSLDPYRDHYTQPVDSARLAEILEQMDEPDI